MSVRSRTQAAKRPRSPELERLIRALEMVSIDLPRLLRKEKEVAFEALDRVDLFEAHMKEMRQIPAHLEALARSVDRSLQVEGAAAHLSRTFQAIHTVRPIETPAWEFPETPGQAEDGRSAPGLEREMAQTPVEASGTARDSVQIDPETGDVRTRPTRRASFHPADLNLEKVRSAIVPGGEISGRSMVQSSRARLVTARASGVGPWRFQFRKGSLEWAAEAEERGLRGVAAMICGDLGYVEIPARRLLETGRDHMERSSGGNPVLRPGVAVYGAEAILHPGAMSRTKPGEATKLAFVEF